MRKAANYMSAIKKAAPKMAGTAKTPKQDMPALRRNKTKGLLPNKKTN